MPTDLRLKTLKSKDSSLDSIYNLKPFPKFYNRSNKFKFINFKSYLIYLFNLISPVKYTKHTNCTICKDRISENSELSIIKQVDTCPKCLKIYGVKTRSIIRDNT